jgi:heme exporter protein D
MADFFAMGGYAAYIWPSYGLTAVVMLGLLALSLRELKDNEATLKALEALRPNRRAKRAQKDAAEQQALQNAGEPPRNAGEPPLNAGAPAAQDG